MKADFALLKFFWDEATSLVKRWLWQGGYSPIKRGGNWGRKNPWATYSTGYAGEKVLVGAGRADSQAYERVSFALAVAGGRVSQSLVHPRTPLQSYINQLHWLRQREVMS